MEGMDTMGYARLGPITGLTALPAIQGYNHAVL